ncbi:hypothetical protein [Thermosynechococcus sp. PKX82]|uniref:hypothetical protein n=1 Tax=Thermosynechococcus sp. PKX82 TaxID=3074086 RepID=UPI0028730E51|nr:hypothetical protein [Thermosynechococcus sp. PKX82]WNC30358.1 hypothetical protein RHH53_02050 [Thermosynechococcus sp. PKX82]
MGAILEVLHQPQQLVGAIAGEALPPRMVGFIEGESAPNAGGSPVGIHARGRSPVLPRVPASSWAKAESPPHSRDT